MQVLSKFRGSEAFQVCMASERSKGHWTTEDLDEAYVAIGCQPNSRKADDDYIIEAYNARKDELTDPTRKRVLREALELITRSRKSDTLQAVLVSTADEDAKPKMDYAKACRLLDLGPDLNGLDDDIILTVYQVRVSDPLLVGFPRSARLMGVLAGTGRRLSNAEYHTTRSARLLC